MKVKTIHGQPSWVLESDCVQMAVTQLGGHMAPVDFRCEDGRNVQPYYMSPWQDEPNSMPEGRSETVLRGDFFCLPFGGGPALDAAETHTPHGQTAGERWSLLPDADLDEDHHLRISMDVTARRGRVERTFSLVDGHAAVYDRTTIHGFAGPTTLGHHAVLAMPASEGALLVSTSPMELGMTYPRAFGDPAKAEYQSLAVNARFESLGRVPSIFAGAPPSDCASYPSRRGFTDLLQIAARPGERGPAWTAAVNTENHTLWFALRHRAILPSTIFWIENGGRHQPPWSGRNCSLGLEDVCSYFDLGIRAAHESNAFSKAGVRTFHQLSDSEPFSVSYIQGALCVPADFGRVANVEFEEAGVTFTDAAGREVSTPICVPFLFGQDL